MACETEAPAAGNAVLVCSLIDGPVSRLTDRHQPINEVLGRDTAELRRQVHQRSDPAERVRDLAAFLTEGWPEPDETALQLAEVVETVSGDRQITRVGQVAELAGRSVRSLQRTFAEYVGAGPKWVIQRCRLHDVAARVAAEETIDWADLAIELGFADQAHLIRAFTATVGTSPAAYAREVHREDP
jgi:AraC-like DNA-binding protein